METVKKPQWKVGDRVKFAHVPANLARTYQVEKVAPKGHITVYGLRGEYAPDRFIAAEPRKKSDAV